MSIELECLHCQSMIDCSSVSDEKRVRCAACENVFYFEQSQQRLVAVDQEVDLLPPSMVTETAQSDPNTTDRSMSDSPQTLSLTDLPTPPPIPTQRKKTKEDTTQEIRSPDIAAQGAIAPPPIAQPPTHPPASRSPIDASDSQVPVAPPPIAGQPLAPPIATPPPKMDRANSDVIPTEPADADEENGEKKESEAFRKNATSHANSDDATAEVETSETDQPDADESAELSAQFLPGRRIYIPDEEGNMVPINEEFTVVNEGGKQFDLHHVPHEERDRSRRFRSGFVFFYLLGLPGRNVFLFDLSSWRFLDQKVRSFSHSLYEGLSRSVPVWPVPR